MSLDIRLIANVCPTCKRGEVVYESNITHNLGAMAKAAGIYDVLWRPEENWIKRAADMIPALEAGIEAMVADPARFRALNPPNGWGKYEGLLDLAVGVLCVAREWPEARVEASR